MIDAHCNGKSALHLCRKRGIRLIKHPDAVKWNDRYQQEGERWLASKPRGLLLDFAHLLPETGLALDAAAGVSMHGMFLAERGLHVLALDISEVGLRLAQQTAAEKGVWLETAVFDLSHLWLPPNTFDVIVNFRFLKRSTFPIYKQALRPGGLLFFETFVRPDTEEEHPHFFLDPGELYAGFCNDLEIVYYDSKEVTGSIRGRLQSSEQLVARKPK